MLTLDYTKLATSILFIGQPTFVMNIHIVMWATVGRNIGGGGGVDEGVCG